LVPPVISTRTPSVRKLSITPPTLAAGSSAHLHREGAGRALVIDAAGTPPARPWRCGIADSRKQQRLLSICGAWVNLRT
jgi:hypothetical protein